MSHRSQIVECTIRSEIVDWFQKHIGKTFGSNVRLRYLTNDEHFKTNTRVEITTSENQINDVIEFLGDTSELLQYKLPWLNGTTYYVVLPSEIDLVTQKLKKIMTEDDYDITTYYITGCPLIPFNFREDLDDLEKLEIDEIFKALPRKYSLLFTFPKTRAARSQSSFQLGVNILRGYHGEYLQYLNLEDILSLEMANNGQDSGPDGHLHHDIQMFLRSKYPDLYEGKTIENLNFREFRLNEVLRYFIHKYHNRFHQISISNILSANESRSLSKLYNIEISCNKLIHIDFRSANECETVDFCAIYHFDPNGFYFLNYGSKYASENHVINFNADASLQPLRCNKEFSYLVIKSQNNCSPQKTNSVLKYVTDHFRTFQNYAPCLVLYEFDLTHVSRPILRSVLKMMRHGRLEFHKMDFNLETFNEILEQSVQNLIYFFQCRIANLEENSINSRKPQLTFYDMDVDCNLLCSLNNSKCLEVTNCRIFSTSWNIPIITKISGYILLKNTNFDVATFMRLLYGLQRVPIIILVSCELTSGDFVDRRYFIFRKQIKFQNMIIKIQTLLQILEKCEFQKPITFKNCHFRLEPSESYKFKLNPVKIQFHNIRFDSSTLLTILGSLNNQSYVWIDNSIVLENYFPSSKVVKARYVDFENCRLETNSLLNILGKLSKQTRVVLECCVLLQSTPLDTTILTNLSEMDIVFKNMSIESQFARLILLTNSEIIFDNCCLTFMIDEFSDMSIQSDVSFLNMTFDSPAQLDSLANFTPESTILFKKCNFEFVNLEISNIVIKPLWIHFMKMSIDFKVLLTIMERISENTVVFIEECVIQTIGQLLYTLPVKIKEIRFVNMCLQIETILCMLKGFTNLIKLSFKNCKILCADRVVLPNIKLNPSRLNFRDMYIDVQIFKTLVHHCTDKLDVLVVNCEIKSTQILSNKLMNISHLIIKNVNYSPDVLQLLQYLNKDCSVRYLGELSNQAIIEICTKSFVYGDRLWLPDQVCTKSFCFELFAEFFRTKALKLELDINTEYDLPTHLIPFFESDINSNQFNWNEFKIKLVMINDGTVKLEFLKNGKVIDLFFELNDLLDDSDECVVDYY